MEPDREALRRRLYGRGATEEDRTRYRALVPEEPPEAGAVGAARRRSRTPLLFAAAGLAAVLAIALVPGVIGAGRPPAAVPGPSPSTARRADLPDVVFADAGTVFTRVGQGSEVVPLDTSVVPASGAMTIALAPALRAPIGWRAIRSGAASSTTTEQVLAASTGAAARGAPVLFRFDGAAPNRIAVAAPDGERWTLVVTFLRGASR